MKKLISAVLSLALVSTFAAPAFAAETDAEATVPKLGEATVSIEKVWQNETETSIRPDSITVNIGDEAVELTLMATGKQT